jgi:predicted AlkP superfamily pyrophosphatase or phosphodiesterase
VRSRRNQIQQLARQREELRIDNIGLASRHGRMTSFGHPAPMKHVARLLVILIVVLVAPAAPRNLRAVEEAPSIRLVLLIAVDQCRYDYLTRFRSEFSGGLARLLTSGAVFSNAYLDHYPTVTAVGHSTMLSGATPAISGIIGNDWYDRALGRNVTSVSDPATTLVGGTGEGSSPRKLLVSTVGDELKSASRAADGSPTRPKVLGISLKDRSAILPVGHMADGAYWFDTSSGAFVTSTFYRTDLPTWVAAFNAKKLPDTYAGKAWSFLDTTSGVGHALPPASGSPLYGAVYGSPYGNDLLAALAETAIVAEKLGQRGVTDLLSVSFSSNDAVGHTYGPDSPEVRDVTVRMDRLLQAFFARVDTLVGLDHTLVILTSDHGVAPLPEVQQARRLPGGRIKGEELFIPIENALKAQFGDGKWILSTAGTSPYLNHALIAEKKLDPAEVRRVAAVAAQSALHVARVYTREQLLSAESAPDTIGRRILRSYNLTRSGDLEIVLEPYWMRAASGTTHGTPYSYDAHIPLVFMGPGVRPGRYDGTVALNDLAPTVATMLSVEIPAGSQGRVLHEMLAPAAVEPVSSTR